MAADDKFTGALAEFTFGGTQYLCLTDYSWNGAVEEAVGQCSSATGAQTFRVAGAPNDVFSFNVLIGSQDTTELNALKRGTLGSFEFHPEGDTALFIEMTATQALISQSNLAASTGSLTILALTMGIIGDLTIAAAA